jgi:hypothetical protein
MAGLPDAILARAQERLDALEGAGPPPAPWEKRGFEGAAPSVSPTQIVK